ncbi:MAG: outer membrane protein assembly factor BamB [Chlamydiales bacterium]|jgi:outer membrane protein assembly factor BamB
MISVLLTVGLGMSSAAVADWPQFQGPNRTGKAALAGVDFDWSEGGPEVAWKVDVGQGYGGASVRDGEVFLLDRIVGEVDILRVLDLATGEEKWSFDYPAPGRLNFPGSRTVPTVTEKYIYTMSGFGQLYCFNRKNQDVAWSVDLAEVYGGEMPTFGWSASPLVVDDLVIGTPLGAEVGLVAFDRVTGDEIWITEGVGFSHSTPVLVELHGKRQVLFMSTGVTGTGQEEAAPTMVSSFDPGDGSLIWRHQTVLTRLPIPAPIKVDEDRLFLTGGYRGGSTMLRVEENDSEYSFEELFHIERGSQIHLPLLHEGHLYVLVNENWNNGRARQKEGGLLCLSLEGEEVWRTGAEPFFGRGNAILAGGYLLIQDGHNGVLRVVEPTTAGFELIAEANVFEIDDRSDHEMWSNMALSDGQLLIRSQEHLLCIKL